MSVGVERVDDTSCLCAAGKKTGVRPVRLDAHENVEVWASCSQGTSDAPYLFDCNHALVKKGGSIEYPYDPMLNYSGVSHVHVRKRHTDPHGVSLSTWHEVALEECSCPNVAQRR